MRVSTRAAAIAALALVVASPCWAADDPKDCAAKSTDAERLSCYDAIYRVTPSPATRSGAWTIQREVSKIDDTENVVALIESREPHVAKFGRSEKLSLILMCREHELMTYIIFADVFMSSLNEGGKVTYRVDKKKAQTMSFRQSNDHKALGLWSKSEMLPFVRQLKGSQNLYVSAVPFSDNTVSGEFAMEGVDDALKQVLEACGAKL